MINEDKKCLDMNSFKNIGHTPYITSSKMVEISANLAETNLSFFQVNIGSLAKNLENLEELLYKMKLFPILLLSQKQN